MALYFLPQLYVGNSQIADSGVFTSEPITKGTVLFQYSDISRYNKILSFAQVDALSSQEKDVFLRYFYQIDEDIFAGPTHFHEAPDISLFWNHSCTPNTYFRDEKTICAMRDIQAGEELVYDYATSDSFEFPTNYKFPFAEQCCCGSKECRGRVLPNDWKSPELQRKYQGFFMPYLAKKIANTYSSD